MKKLKLPYFIYKKKEENFRIKKYLFGIKIKDKYNYKALISNVLKDKLDDYITTFFEGFVDINNIKTQGKLKKLNDANLELLRIFDGICTKYNLKYWLAYGTLLGAKRHEGYIPWDYDADVAMLRDDYEKLYDILEEELKDKKIDVFGISKIKKHYGNVIVLKNKSDKPFANLDIIPFDTYYKNITSKEEKSVLSKRIIKGKEYFYKVFPLDKDINSKNEIKEINSKLNTYTKEVILENHPKECDKPTIFKALMTSADKFFQVLYDWDDIFPLKRHKYQDIELNIPNNADKILKEFYGNYDTYPPRFDIDTLYWVIKNIPDCADEVIKELKDIKI